MTSSCPNQEIRNQKARVVSERGDMYVGNDVGEAKRIFDDLKKKNKSVDGKGGISSFILMVDGEIVDVI